MSTAKRRRGHSLHLELPKVEAEELPPVAAVFLILFDVKAGYASENSLAAPTMAQWITSYTIAWKQSVSGCTFRGLQS